MNFFLREVYEKKKMILLFFVCLKINECRVCIRNKRFFYIVHSIFFIQSLVFRENYSRIDCTRAKLFTILSFRGNNSSLFINSIIYVPFLTTKIFDRRK